MKLMSVITTLHPAYGGPAECAIQLHHNFRAKGHEYDIVTLDPPEAPWNKRLPFDPICLGKKSGGKKPVEPALIDFLKQNQARYDGSILHGIWTFANVAMRLAWDGMHRYVLFPHGMLDPYFIHNFPIKHIKKNLFYRAVAAPLMSNALATLFTCDEEKRLAANSYRPVSGNRVVVRYGISAPPEALDRTAGRFAQLRDELAGKDVILFLGRIHPKKGCDLLIEAMGQVADRIPRAHVIVAGPDETGWVAKLKKLAQSRNVHDRFSWVGPAFGDDRWLLYNMADAFILPSHMENFGMTIAESLSQGVPVLTTDKVNIHTSISKACVGYIAPDTVHGTASLLESWATTGAAERTAMRIRAKELFRQEFQAIHTATDVLNVFETAASRNQI